MSFWRQISPRGAVSDLVHQWKQPTPHRWQILGVSVAATFALITLFVPESQRVPPAEPEITWITTFAPNRTDQEIIQSNIENQKKQDYIRARKAEAEERRKDAFRAIGRATGLDVDALEKQYSDDPSPSPSAAPARTTGER